jgi:hypothetical protein
MPDRPAPLYEQDFVRSSEEQAAELPRTARLAGRLLADRGKGAPDLAARLAAANYTPEQVLDDWFPES